MPDELPEVPIVTPVVKAAEETPQVVVHAGKDATEIPPAMVAESFHALATAINRLSDVTEKSLEASKQMIEEPVQASEEIAEDIAPEVVTPKPDRFVRRNGRRVKRG